jgi:hypothetical protein
MLIEEKNEDEEYEEGTMPTAAGASAIRTGCTSGLGSISLQATQDTTTH